MASQTNLRKTTDAAVFARNHREYLEAAAARNRTDPERPTTFRARTIWRTALNALQMHKTLPVYLVPVGGKSEVEFSAVLHHVKLHPERGDADTETYLGFALTDAEVEGTGDEGLWEQFDTRVMTLYVITHCKPVTPFPLTELIKLSDGIPISADYGYSYCMVHAHTPAPGDDLLSGPDDVRDPALYSEGTSRTVSVNVFERSRVARDRCISHYGLDCAVCGFNFGRVYGKGAQGIIHVHHLKSLAEVDEAHDVDPVRDLRPVCPNCHAVIHSAEKPLTIDEVKEMIQS